MMKYNKILKNNETNKNTFLVACVCSIVLLLTLCYFGINGNLKGTAAAVTCGSGYTEVEGYCCPSGYTSIYSHNDVVYCTTYVNEYSERLTYLGSLTTSSGKKTWDFNSLVCLDPVPDCSATHTMSGYDCYSSFSEEVTGVASYVGLNISTDISKCSVKADSGYACYYNEDSNFYSWMKISTGDALYEKTDEYTSEYACNLANNKVAQFWYGEDDFYKSATCTIDPGIERFDGTCQITVPEAPTKDGYKFLGWDFDSSCDQPLDLSSTIKITEDMAYYACWEKDGATSELIIPNLTVEQQIDLKVSENKTVTYTYNGDGKVNCSVSDTTVATCSINTSSKQVTITGKKVGRAVLTLSATAGTSYSAKSVVSDINVSDETPSTYTYTATFNKNNGTLNGNSTLTCTSSVSNKCTLDDTFEIPTATRTGYTFKGWGTSSSCTSGKTVDLVMTDLNVTYYACWSANTYTVTYNANGGSGAPSAQTFTYGSTLVLSSTKPTKSNCTFTNWNMYANGSGTQYSAGASYSAAANVTLYAQWSCDNSGGSEVPTTYTVTYDANGGSATETSENVESGKTVTLPSATKSGHTFNGWYTSASGGTKAGNAGATYTVTSNVTLYAQWTTNAETPTTKTFTVTFNPNGGTLSGNSSDTCTTTSTSCNITDLPSATKSGYTFNGWGASKSCASVSTSKLTLTSNATYYACYTKNANNNVDDNPQTGEIVIALVWFAGIFAIAYSVYYFRKIKGN